MLTSRVHLFTSARFKLTAWYVFTIVIISSTISIIYYLRTSTILQHQFELIETRWQRERANPRGPQAPPPLALEILAEDLVETKRALTHQLVFINGGLAIITAILGSILSGRTLKPIELAHEAQQRFIGDAAHELRTPITALKTSLEVNLMDPTVSAEAKKFLRENLEDVVTLESLTSNLLRLSYQEEITREFSRVSITTAIQQALKITAPLALKKKITLSTQLSEKPLAMTGDHASLVDLFVTLIDNAIKYSAPETTVSVTAKEVGFVAHLSVSDQGIGIAKHHLPHIFDRFYRVAADRTRQPTGGHGLGLSIAQKIAFEHGGSIQVKSKTGAGTTFVVKLPLQ